MTVSAIGGGGAAAAIGIGAGAPPAAALPALATTGANIEELMAFGVGMAVLGLVMTLGIRRRHNKMWAQSE